MIPSFLKDRFGGADGTREYWQKLWENKRDPLHSESTDDYYDRLGNELRLVLPERFERVLDVGCGNGVLYNRLGFDKVSYHGIDFSPSMIEDFKQRHPNARAEVLDLRDYNATEPLDLIFSHGVVQNLTYKEFEAFLKRTSDLLSPGGSAIHAGVLDRSAMWNFYRGSYSKGPRSLFRSAASFLVVKTRFRRSVGNWFGVHQVKQTANMLGLEHSIRGSLLYPYRFHVTLKKPSA